MINHEMGKSELGVELTIALPKIGIYDGTSFNMMSNDFPSRVIHALYMTPWVGILKFTLILLFCCEA